MKPFVYHSLFIALLSALSSHAMAQEHTSCGSGDNVTCNATTLSLTDDEKSSHFSVYLGKSSPGSQPHDVVFDDKTIAPAKGFMFVGASNYPLSLRIENVADYQYTDPSTDHHLAIGVLNQQGASSLSFASNSTIVYRPNSYQATSFLRNSSNPTLRTNTVLGAYGIDGHATANLQAGTFVFEKEGSAVQAIGHSQGAISETVAQMSGGLIKRGSNALTPTSRLIEAQGKYSDDIHTALKTETAATTRSDISHDVTAKMIGGQILFTGASNPMSDANSIGAALYASNDWYGTAEASFLFSNKRTSTADHSADPYAFVDQSDPNAWDVEVSDMHGAFAGVTLGQYSRTNAKIQAKKARVRVIQSTDSNQAMSVLYVRTAGTGNNNAGSRVGETYITIEDSDLAISRLSASKRPEHAAIHSMTEFGGLNNIYISNSTVTAKNAAVLVAQMSRNIAGADSSLTDLSVVNQGFNRIGVDNSTLIGAYGLITRSNNTNPDLEMGQYYYLSNYIRFTNSTLYATRTDETLKAAAITLGAFEGQKSYVEIKNYGGDTKLDAASYLIYDEDSLSEANADSPSQGLEKNPLTGDKAYGGGDTEIKIEGVTIENKYAGHTGNKISLQSGNDWLFLSNLSKESLANISLLDGGLNRHLTSGDLDTDLDVLHIYDVASISNYTASDEYDIFNENIHVAAFVDESKYGTFASGALKNWELIHINRDSQIKLTEDVYLGKRPDSAEAILERFKQNYPKTYDDFPLDSWGYLGVSHATLLLSNPNGLVVDGHFLNRSGALVLGGLTNQGSITYTIKGNYDFMAASGRIYGNSLDPDHEDYESQFPRPYIVIYSQLGGDDSPTTRLLIQGNVNGLNPDFQKNSTLVIVKNKGGLGAATARGIPVIEVQGDEPKDSDFVLDETDGPLTVGEHTYELVRDGKIFYLRSAPFSLPPMLDPTKLEPTMPKDAPAYLLTPHLLSHHVYEVMAARSHRRMGDISSQASKPAQERLSWAKVLVSGTRLQNQNSTVMAWDNHATLQLGSDLIARVDKDGKRQHMGLFVNLGKFNTEIHKAQLGSLIGKFKGRLYGLSAYHTIFSPTSRYIDMVGGVFYMTQDYRPHRSTSQANQTAIGASASIEVGKTYGIHHAKDPFFIEPQAQLTAQWMSYRAAKADKDLPKTQAYRDVNLISRLGVRIGYRNLIANKSTYGSSSYLTANVFHRWSKNPDIHIEGNRFKDHYPNTWYELGLGVQVPYRKQTMIYGGLNYQNAFKSTRTGLLGELGLRYAW